MALVVADRVKETTTTQGNGSSYALAGPETGFESFSVIGNGNKTYYCCTDGTDFEIGIGTYTASGTTLSRHADDVLQSSNNDGLVNWGSGTKDIFVTQPADKAVFLNADGDIEFDNTHRIKITSNNSEPVLDIGGSGPNFITFRAGSDFSSLTNAVQIVYRTSPSDLLIETSGTEKIAELGGDDGHAKLYYNTAARLETTGNGIDITGHIDFLDSTAPNYENRLRFGAGYDLQIFSDGTHGYMHGSGRNDLLVAFDEVKFVSQDYSTFRLHITSAGDVNVSTGHLGLGDNQEVKLGDDADFIIKHSGSANVIRDTGANSTSKAIYIQTDETVNGVNLSKVNATETMAKFIPDGACELYHNDSLKFNTTLRCNCYRTTGRRVSSGSISDSQSAKAFTLNCQALETHKYLWSVTIQMYSHK